jgi:hypothetical protein
MKTLYFDIDGTILLSDQHDAKPCLANGRLEAAIRKAGFRKLVCVGNFSRIAEMLRGSGVEYDELAALLSICRGAFSDEPWFRAVTRLIANPEHRTGQIDFSSDWWYVDDLAAEYLRAANQEDVLRAHLGTRIFIPSRMGNGQDVIDWLDKTV